MRAGECRGGFPEPLVSKLSRTGQDTGRELW